MFDCSGMSFMNLDILGNRGPGYMSIGSPDSFVFVYICSHASHLVYIEKLFH